MTETPSAPPPGHSPFTTPKKGLGAGVIALIVVGVLVLVGVPCGLLGLGIVLPALANAREAAVKVMSQNNMRAIGTGIMSYAADNNDHLPAPASAWQDLLIDGGYLASPDVFTHPSWQGPGDAYIYVGAGRFQDIQSPSIAVILHEADGVTRDGRHELYADGSVQFVPAPQP